LNRLYLDPRDHVFEVWTVCEACGSHRSCACPYGNRFFIARLAEQGDIIVDVFDECDDWSSAVRACALWNRRERDSFPFDASQIQDHEA